LINHLRKLSKSDYGGWLISNVDVTLTTA